MKLIYQLSIIFIIGALSMFCYCMFFVCFLRLIDLHRPPCICSTNNFWASSQPQCVSLFILLHPLHFDMHHIILHTSTAKNITKQKKTKNERKGLFDNRKIHIWKHEPRRRRCCWSCGCRRELDRARLLHCSQPPR